MVHFLGADLHLDRHAVRAEQRRVQRLVAVHARDRDVVLEASRHRLVDAVHDAERAVAGVRVADDDAEPEDVDDLGERDLLAPHLLVDAVEVLLAALDPCRYAGLFERRLERVRDAADELLLVALGLADRGLEDLVAARIQRAEAEILELHLDRVHAEPVRDRRVDLERLARDRAPLGRRHRAERAHVVRAVGELDHDDADVPHHREQHLAEALGLRLGAAVELDLVELADAVDEFRDLRAEAGRDLVLGRRGVLDDVVQDRGDQRLGVEPQVGEQVGDRDRMGDVGLARAAALALVGLEGEVVGGLDALDVLGRQVALELVDQLVDADGPSSVGQQAAQGRRDVHGWEAPARVQSPRPIWGARSSPMNSGSGMNSCGGRSGSSRISRPT